MLKQFRALVGVIAVASVMATWPVGAGAEGPRVPFAEDAPVVVLPTPSNFRPAIESDEAFLRGKVWANGIHPDWSFADAAIAPGPPSSEDAGSRKPEIANLHLHPDYWVAAAPQAPTPPQATATTDLARPVPSGS